MPADGESSSDATKSRPETTDDEQHSSGDIEHITAEQLTRIEALKRFGNAVAKWETIYGIIFGGEQEIPCPFVLSTEQILRYAQERPQWVLDGLSESMSGDLDAPDPGTLLRYVPHLYRVLRRGGSSRETRIAPTESFQQIDGDDSGLGSVLESGGNGDAAFVGHNLSYDGIESAGEATPQAEELQMDQTFEYIDFGGNDNDLS
jgi:hypothetical protein